MFTKPLSLICWRKVNKAFKKQSLSYSGNGSKTGSLCEIDRGLRGLQQQSDEEIKKYSSARAEALFTKHKIVGPLKFRCWHCKTVMRSIRGKGKTLFCLNGKCPKQRSRMLIRNPEVAFSAFASECRAGYKPDYDVWLRICYQRGIKTPPDTMGHNVRRSHMSIRTAHHIVDRVLPKINMALAWKEDQHGRTTTVARDIVDMDTAKHGKERLLKKTKDVPPPPKKRVIKKPAAQKRAGETVHRARAFAFKGRTTGRWGLRSLPSKRTQRGAPVPPEQTEEVLAAVQGCLGPASIGATDAGHALQKAGSSSDKPMLPGARHNLLHFTPLGFLAKKNLDKETIAFLRKQCKPKAMPKGKARPFKGSPAEAKYLPMAKELKTGFKLVGGDQGCESIFAHVSGQMGRLGSKRATHGDKKSIDMLAAAATLRRPGLETILSALRDFRAFQNGRVAPSAAFSDMTWLSK